MPFAMTLACFGMGMTFEEALTAATINAAWSLDRAGSIGSLEPGKQMDAVLVSGDAINLIRVGAPSIAAVIKRGRIIANRTGSLILDDRHEARPTTSLTDLLAAFQSPAPTPGGGSAAALAGAVGASLLAMVAGLPKPRAATADDLAQLAAAGAGCVALSERLTALIDRDSEAYQLVVAAFRMPKETDEEKAVRGARIQEALRMATETPLDVMRACADAIGHAARRRRVRQPSCGERRAGWARTAGRRAARREAERGHESREHQGRGVRHGRERRSRAPDAGRGDRHRGCHDGTDQTGLVEAT